jgi:hypothetical protein
MSLLITVLEDAAALLMIAMFIVPLLLIARGAGWAWERRGPSRLDRVLAQCERDRADLDAMKDAARALFREAVVEARADELEGDPALRPSMERRVTNA